MTEKAGNQLCATRAVMMGQFVPRGPKESHHTQQGHVLPHLYQYPRDTYNVEKEQNTYFITIVIAYLYNNAIRYPSQLHLCIIPAL